MLSLLGAFHSFICYFEVAATEIFFGAGSLVK